MRPLVLLLVLAWAPVGLAQDVVPDTTSPARYFPLEVGNEWHYVRYGEFFDELYWGADYQYHRWHVSEILEIGGREYAIRIQESASVPVPAWYEIGRDTIRFDANASVVIQLTNGREVVRSCPLDADFGSTVTCRVNGHVQDVTVEGGLLQTEDLEGVWNWGQITTAVKRFIPADSTALQPIYAADVGFLGHRNDPHERREWQAEDDFDLFHAQNVTGAVVQTHGVPEVQARMTDPTSPELYYPLTPGFIREDLWRRYGDERRSRTEVRGDSLVNNQSYSIVWTSTVDVPLGSTDPGRIDPVDWGAGTIWLIRFDSETGQFVSLDSSWQDDVRGVPFGTDFGVLVGTGPLPDGRQGSYVVEGGVGGATTIKGERVEYESVKNFLGVPFLLIADIGYPNGFAARIGRLPQTNFGFCEPIFCVEEITYLRMVNADGSRSEYGEQAVVVASDASPTLTALTLRAFPSPTAGPVTLALDFPDPQPVELAAFDALGRRVWNDELASGTGCQRVEIDASAWAPGLYIVRAVAGDASSTATVVRR
ncbi:MAG: hypothetical protein Rubg2KO_38110 [Rubricoccaceae bacterium]